VLQTNALLIRFRSRSRSADDYRHGRTRTQYEKARS